MTTRDKPGRFKCCACRREIQEGRDVFELREGVLGLRGLVPLEPERHFCSRECLEGHFNGEEREVKGRRVP